jgi:hypothetical protein
LSGNKKAFRKATERYPIFVPFLLKLLHLISAVHCLQLVTGTHKVESNFVWCWGGTSNDACDKLTRLQVNIDVTRVSSDLELQHASKQTDGYSIKR